MRRLLSARQADVRPNLSQWRATRRCGVARDEVVVFVFETGECLGAVARLPRLNGQAVIFFP
jgi:hypothetical protein